MSAWEGLTPPYSTIVADPPWCSPRFGGNTRRGHPRKHYTVTTTDDICAMPVADIAAPNAHLWVWGTNAMMEDAYRVVRAWGFSPITVVTWCKQGPGVGYYLRNNTEHAIFATRGKPLVPDTKAMASWFVWPRGEHSAKPDAFLDLVEQVSPGPYVELFCRRPRFGWDSWGYGYEQARTA